MFDKKSGRCGLGEYNSIFELIRPEVPRYLCPIKCHFIVLYGLFRFYSIPYSVNLEILLYPLASGFAYFSIENFIE